MAEPVAAVATVPATSIALVARFTEPPTAVAADEAAAGLARWHRRAGRRLPAGRPPRRQCACLRPRMTRDQRTSTMTAMRAFGLFSATSIAFKAVKKDLPH